MLRKFMVIAASTALLTFGGAFSTTADAEAVEKNNLSYKVYYSINGQEGTVTEENASSFVKKALETIQSKYLTNINMEELKNQAPTKEKEVEKEEPVDHADNKEEQVNEPAPAEQVDEKKEEPVAQPTPQPEETQEKEESQEETEEQTELSEFEVQVVELTNAERAQNGLSALQIDEELSKVAREKSKDMASNQYFDHNSPVYGSPFDMMGSFGIDYHTAGENIAKGQRSPQEVVDAWMNSPGHRENILNGDFTHIGVGFVEQGNHWTQMFIGK